MGAGWWIHTFDRAKWDAIFGSGRPEAEQKIVDAQLGEIEGYFDGSEKLRPGPDRQEILASPEGQAALVLAAHLIENGFTYDDLGQSRAVMLDEFACTVCAPESLGNFLDIKWHSPGLPGRAHHFAASRPSGICSLSPIATLQEADGGSSAARGAAISAYACDGPTLWNAGAAHVSAPLPLCDLLPCRSGGAQAGGYSSDQCFCAVERPKPGARRDRKVLPGSVERRGE